MPNGTQDSTQTSLQGTGADTKATGPSSLEFNENAKTTIDLLKKNLDELQEGYHKLNKEIENTKKDFLTIFGLFASFMTFLSIEIQIFKTISSVFLLLGLSSFLLGGIIFFALTLRSIVNGNNEIKLPWWSPATFFIILSIGCFTLYAFFGIKESKTENQDNKICMVQNTTLAQTTFKKKTSQNINP